MMNRLDVLEESIVKLSMEGSKEQREMFVAVRDMVQVILLRVNDRAMLDEEIAMSRLRNCEAAVAAAFGLLMVLWDEENRAGCADRIGRQVKQFTDLMATALRSL